MNWQISWTAPAVRDLRHLPPSDADRIRDAVIRLGQTGQGNVERLKTCSEWRLRVGDFRVRFTYDKQTRQIVILRVLHRKDAYRS